MQSRRKGSIVSEESPRKARKMRGEATGKKREEATEKEEAREQKVKRGEGEKAGEAERTRRALGTN